MLTLLRAALRFLLITSFTLLIALAVFTGLLRLGLPYASTYKNEIQAWVSDYLKTPVEIGTMNLGWDGFSPHITLDDVALAQDDGRNLNVTLEQIDLDFNLFKSLYQNDLHINDVAIIGANLSVEYVGKSNFKVSSISFSDSGDSDNSDGAATGNLDVVSWLLNARQVGLLNSRIKLIDKVRGINYQIDNLNIRAENNGDDHQIRVDMLLPDQLGQSLEVGADFVGDSENIALSEGQFYINTSDLRIQNWLKIWPERGVDAAGVADIEIWGGWGDKQLQSMRVRLDGNHMEIVEGATSAASNDIVESAEVTASSEVNYPSVKTDLTWRRDNQGWRLEVDQLDFEHAGKSSQIQSGIVSLTGDGADKKLRIAGSGDRLDLAGINNLLATFTQLTALEPVAQHAAQARLSGALENWRVDALVPSSEMPMVNVKARANNVSFENYASMPGISGFTGEVDIADNKGQLILASSDITLQHPRVFPEPLLLSQIKGAVDIDLNNQTSLIHSQDLVIANDGFEATTEFVVGKNEDDRTVYEVKSKFALADIAKVKHYLPLGVMRARLVKWLNLAPQAGELQDGSLNVRGVVGELPWHSDQGLFTAEFKLQNATVAYRPGWPEISAANGLVNFKNESMTFVAESGEMAGTTVNRTYGAIRNFRKPVLQLSSSVQGPLQALLDFAADGPLKATLEPAFGETSSRGDTRLELATTIPLRPKRFRKPDEVFAVDGRVRLAQNYLRFDRFKVDLSSVSGDIGFTQSGIAIDAVKALYLGQPVTIRGESEQEGDDRKSTLRFDGLFHANKVLAQYGIPVADFLEGPSKWKINLQIPHRRQGEAYPGVKLVASSDMIGTSITLPTPLAKGAGSARVMSITSRFTGGSQQHWDIRYDTLMRARVKAKTGLGMQSLSIALGSAPLQDQIDTAIRIDGDVNAVSFDGWIRAINQMIGSTASAEAPQLVRPVYADIRTGQMVVGNRLLGPASVRINTDDNNINATLSNAHLRSNIRFPRKHWDDTKAVRTRIAMVDQEFFKALTSPGQNGDGGLLDPRTLPPLNVHIAELRLNAYRFKNIGLRTQPSQSGLSITALGFANDASQLVGEGYWRLKDPQQINSALPDQHVSHLDLKFQSDNLGKALADMGNSSAMADGRGVVSLLLSWSGAVYKPDLRSLDGKVSIRFRDGRLLRVEPGAAKLIGLFALQEIPRRLSLDFRDVVKDGLDYGKIDGDITIDNGVATTHLLQLDGPIGVIDVTGVSDLNQQTIDQRIQVLPRVSAALPLIGLLSGGATAGIGALLATPILKKLGIDFDRIGLTEYSLKGSWKDPVVSTLNEPPEYRDFSQSRD